MARAAISMPRFISVRLESFRRFENMLVITYRTDQRQSRGWRSVRHIIRSHHAIRLRELGLFVDHF